METMETLHARLRKKNSPRISRILGLRRPKRKKLPPNIFFCWGATMLALGSSRELTYFTLGLGKSLKIIDSKVPAGTWRLIPVSKWLGSPPFISHEKAIWKGNAQILRGLTITMVIIHWTKSWDDPPSRRYVNSLYHGGAIMYSLEIENFQNWPGRFEVT